MIRTLSLLACGVRPRAVLWTLAALALPLAAMLSVPLVVALVSGEQAAALRYAPGVVLLTALGLLRHRIGMPASLQINEAMTVTTLAFVLGALGFTWPFLAEGLPLSDALFEATSAITTTGLSTVDVEGRSPAFLFARSWGQWVGGLGIVVLAVALVLTPGASARRLIGEAVPEDLVTSTRIHARRVLVAYVALTALGATLLWLTGLRPFEALVHALSAVSTGGFSTHGGSVADFASTPPRIALGVIFFFGAVSFSLQFSAWREGPGRLVRDLELRAMLGITAVVAVVLAVTMALSAGELTAERVGHAAFLAVSAETTAGFSSVEVTALDSASKAVLIGAMLIGGDLGSTAGGIKILRLLVLLHLARLLIVRASLPRHAVVEMRVAGRTVDDAEIHVIVGLVVLWGIVAAVSWLPFLLLGHAPLDSLFEVVSALGTVGLSTGLTTPDLEPLLKLTLCANMLMGRLEILALLIPFHPRTWLGRRTE